MVSIPTEPTISCGIGQIPVAVVTTYKGGLLPISGVDVEFRGLAIPFVPQEKESKTTNILGLAETCKIVYTYIEVWVKKTGIDFGTGSGNWKLVGSGRPSSPTFYKQESTTSPGLAPPPPITSPCIGTITADVPNFSTLLSGLSLPPTSILIPVSVTGSRTSVPMRILVDGKEVEKKSTGFTSFNLINALNYVGADINVAHTITIESTSTECSITPFTFTSPSLKPTGIPSLPVIPTPTQLCSQLMTTPDNPPSHQSEITDLNSTFYVYVRGIKEVCKSDPTNPSFINKVPKGTPGTVTLGNLSSTFYLTDDGIADLDLSKLFDLKSLSGFTGGLPSPTPVVTQQVTQQTPTKTGNLGEPGIFYVSLPEVQTYLNQYFPGGIAESGTGTWTGAYKITRGTGGKYPAGTYFWTKTWQDIKQLY